MNRTPFVAAAIVVVTAMPLFAQQPPSTVPSERIVARTPSAVYAVIQGTVARPGKDSVVRLRDASDGRQSGTQVPLAIAITHAIPAAVLVVPRAGEQ